MSVDGTTESARERIKECFAMYDLVDRNSEVRADSRHEGVERGQGIARSVAFGRQG